MDGCLVKADVPMRGADAVPVDDWSFMEYTFTPAIYRNQHITDNTFDRDWTQCRSPFVDTSYIGQILLTCVCGVSRLTELLSRNIHSPLISCRT